MAAPDGWEPMALADVSESASAAFAIAHSGAGKAPAASLKSAAGAFCGIMQASTLWEPLSFTPTGGNLPAEAGFGRVSTHRCKPQPLKPPSKQAAIIFH
jgi:hypothetical protein